MPRKPDMCWSKSQYLWRKVYRGRTYTVSPKQLREQGYEVRADTKEGSYLAANAWWSKKWLELENANKPAPRPVTPEEQTAFAYMGLPAAMHEEWARFCDEGHDGGVPTQVGVRMLLEAFMQHYLIEKNPLPEDMVKLLPAARVQQLETAGKLFRGQPATEPARTVQANAEAFIKKQQAQAAAGQMAPARVDNNRIRLAHFVTFLGPQSDVAGIDAEKLDAFYLHCLGQVRRPGGGWSVEYAKTVFSLAKTFVRWLWERGACELPRNIDGKFRFGSPAKAVKTWTVDEYKQVVSEAPGKLKLALLLMVNCGMTQKDVSDLLDSEVDWITGRIIRKRSKTKSQEAVPVVNYKLWPSTFELLKKYRSHQERVLLTESGQPYVRTRLNEEGKLVKADNIASNYAHLKKRLKFTRPLKQLRKLGASLLSSHKDYGRFASYFLGHSPRTVADRHYVVPPQELFDEAILWLGRQVGQVS